MPELPEVETVKRGLSKFIIQKTITKIEVLNEKSFIGKPALGKVIKLRRFGKALVIDLDNNHSLIIHLRMTGQLIYDGEERYAAGHPSENFVATLPNKQTRVIIHFENGTLYFNDQRKFGFVKSVLTKDVEDDSFIKKLAPEPWVMTAENFYERLKRHKNSCIKATILDQTIICGLGNIYADESLFMSQIHPERRCGSITEQEAEKLLRSARAVMEKSIEAGGSTLNNYVKADGTRGDYLDKFAQVFHREGKNCPVCNEKIIKIRVAGRGTHLCPSCQKIGKSCEVEKLTSQKEVKND